MDIAKKLIPFLTACAIFPVAADASFPGISQDKYIRGYVKNVENVPVYIDSKLKIQGTTKPYKEYDSVLYPTTEIQIYEIRDNWAYVSYNSFWSGKREGYIKLSALTALNFDKEERIASKRIDAVYKRPGETFPNSAIYAGDTVYTIGKAGEYTEVVYPASTVYKIAWIKNSDYETIKEIKGVQGTDLINLNLKVSPITYESLFTMSKGEELPDITKTEQSLLITLAMKYAYQNNAAVTSNIVKSKGLMKTAELFPEGLNDLDFEYLSYYCPIKNAILNRAVIALAENKPVIIGGKGKTEAYSLITSYNGVNAGKFAAKNFVVYDPKTKTEKSLADWLSDYETITKIVF